MLRVTRALLLAALAALLLPGLVLAHPLGNFTINHYAGVRIEQDRVLLDVVIDQAEIPAFQARQTLDTDEDGEVSDAELEAGRVSSCASLAGDLHLAVDGDRLNPQLTAAGISLRPGVGGLSTLRLVCGYQAALAAAVADDTRVEFADMSYAGRIGWREIVVEGSGVTVTPIGSELRDTSVSDRLLLYPPAMLENALADERVVLLVAPGGAELPPIAIPDATPFATSAGAPSPAEAVPAAAVPGGVAGEIPALFQTADLTPFVILLSLATAAALGAAHALTPGHGKTLMAAYLVGTRGTPVHAVGLGLSVSISHTIGILALASLVIGAQRIVDPDLIVRAAPVVAAIGIVAIGSWMLVGELRRRSARRARERAAEHDHDHQHDHAHSHGGIRHSHSPADGASISWRSLFVLGLAGGIIPSTSALLILLGAIASGRAAFGIVLVVAFGLGMALVMTGIGLVVVGARGRLDRVGTGPTIARLRTWLPLTAACLVLGLGIYLTFQAVAAPPTL
jgi:ABC-type nickel/cobalt efflux system permease component RcnA